MIAIVVAAFFIGWCVAVVKPIPSYITSGLEKYVISVALPAVIISKMSRVTIERELLIPIASAWVVMAACAALVLFVARTYQWNRTITGALLCVAVLGNTSFLGLGMVEGLLGAKYLAGAIAYDQLGTFLALSLWGAFVAGKFGSQEATATDIVIRLFRFAPFVALLISVPVRHVSVPSEIFGVLDAIGKTVAPVAMATVGLRFRLRVSHTVIVPALWGLGIKMLFVPAIVVGVVLFAGWNNDMMWSTVVVQSGAPPMVTAGIIAVRAQLDEQVVAFVVGIGTIIGFVSVPLLSLFV